MIQPVQIGNRLVGPGQPCFIIAEAGVNHNGDVDLAKRLIWAAKSTGADCVKFQMFKAEDVVTADAPKAEYQLHTTDPSESQFNMLKSLELPWSTYPDLIREANEAGLMFLCTCYSEDEIDYLDELGMKAFKLASCQIVELPFLAYVARKSKPMIVSTGMATLAEIDEAIRVIRSGGNEQIILLQCTTNYPSDVADANLRVIPTLARSFGLPVGYSDHTIDDTSAIVAVACGAVVVEKHFTLDKSLPGPDHSSSLDPNEFAVMVKRLRDAEAALGSEIKSPTQSELANARGMRRSRVAVKHIPAGTVITREMVGTKRPYVGLPPSFLARVIGALAKVDIPKDSPITLELLTW